MESSVVQLMKTHSTVPVLVAAVLRQQKNVSIYIQDQVRININVFVSSEKFGRTKVNLTLLILKAIHFKK
jgi:hypothetical protein